MGGLASGCALTHSAGSWEGRYVVRICSFRAIVSRGHRGSERSWIGAVAIRLGTDRALGTNAPREIVHLGRYAPRQKAGA